MMARGLGGWLRTKNITKRGRKEKKGALWVRTRQEKDADVEG